jgi:hypothetical protein
MIIYFLYLVPASAERNLWSDCGIAVIKNIHGSVGLDISAKLETWASYHVHASGFTTTIELSPVDVVAPAFPIERETNRFNPEKLRREVNRRERFQLRLMAELRYIAVRHYRYSP